MTDDSTQPGRTCPLHYRYAPQDFARVADFHADTLYVIGGLYGNVPALEAILALAATEPSPVTLCFNGDFNWFNIDDAGFRAINGEVLRHRALRGNVETEIADDASDAGCGCGYPEDVSDAEVARSNAIAQTLRDTARRHADLRTPLATLPMNLVADVGGVRVAIVHGDLESLAGWSLSQESLALAKTQNIVLKQILMTRCSIVASSHTCLPVALTLNDLSAPRAIFNNGAAGMPNFRGSHAGVITRIATSLAPPSPKPLYGARVGNLHLDALPVLYDHARWLRDFLANWPAGSAGHTSYYSRIVNGPAYAVTDADRIAVSNSEIHRPSATA